MTLHHDSNRRATSAISRRGLLGAGLGLAAANGPWNRAAAAAAAAAVAPATRSTAARDPNETVLVVLNLRGGNDGLNTVVPTGLNAYFDRRRQLALDPTEVRPLDVGPYATAGWGLHPALGNLRDLWQDGQLAIVHKVGYPQPDLSHFLSQDVWARGTREPAGPTATDSGWCARFKDSSAARNEYGVIGLRTGSILEFQGGSTRALIVSSVEDFRVIDTDPIYPLNADYRNEVVQRILAANRSGGAGKDAREIVRGAFDKQAQFASINLQLQSSAGFPDTELGRTMRDAALLIASPFKVRLAYLTTSDYDTHSEQLMRQQDLLADLDASLGAFTQALRDLNAWSNVVFAVVSEFGRMTIPNGSGGTEHGTSNNVLVGGGPILGGMYGELPTNADLSGPFFDFRTDFREVYAALVDRHLGGDPDLVFPEAPTTSTPLGFI